MNMDRDNTKILWGMQTNEKQEEILWGMFIKPHFQHK